MAEKLIYLDNAAASGASEYALERFAYYAKKCFVNQEAGHLQAFALRQEIAKASKRLASALLNENFNVLYGSSATEMLNCVCFIDKFNDPKANIVTTKAEHSALTAALGRCAAEKRYVKITKNAQLDLAGLSEKCDKNTVLAAIHHVQGETGAIQDFAAISKVIKQAAPQALLLADTVQSACKLPLPSEFIDFAFISGHKVAACGGAAMFYKDKAFTPIFAQLRAKDYLLGRGEPPLLLSMTDCAVQHAKGLKQNLARTTELNAYLRRLLADIPDLRFTVDAGAATPYIVHLTLAGCQGAIIVRALSEHNICVSAGAACESESKMPSKALSAMGFSRNDAYSGLRVSFSFGTTKAELDSFAAMLAKTIQEY